MSRRRELPTGVVRRLRTSGAGNPPGTGRAGVYVLHPGGLPVSEYERLRDALPDSVGLTVFDLYGVEPFAKAAMHGGIPETSVEELAEECRKALAEELQADETYLLAGWSLGGVIAQRLAASADLPHRPEHLVLFDSVSNAPGYRLEVEDLSQIELMEWFAQFLGALRRVPLYPPAPLTPGMNVDEGLQRLLDRALELGAAAPGTTIGGFAKAYQVFINAFRRNCMLVNAYWPPRIDLPATLFRAERSLVEEEGPLGWQHYLENFEIVTAPGDHYNIFTNPPAVSMLVDVITRHLPAALLAQRPA